MTLKTQRYVGFSDNILFADFTLIDFLTMYTLQCVFSIIRIVCESLIFLVNFLHIPKSKVIYTSLVLSFCYIKSFHQYDSITGIHDYILSRPKT